ncbi:MAG: trypsin-like peptidase domain-containing protein [Planctomycetaceae bacterium]|nr:trypsin-like peptidase domain-containing protein [Planctomycetaceae bacterium]
MPVSSTRLISCLRAAAAVIATLGCLWDGAWASELRMTPLVRAVQSARPSIVNIHGEKLVGDAASAAPGDRRRVNGMGTGVIIDERGYIITNHHVVDGVKKILVTTHDEQTFVAALVSHDPKTDLAIIKIDSAQPLTVIRIGTSADLMTGETVIAVGNAFGYEHTVTQGIISALHRSVQVSDTQSYQDLIQTDASINPGNSGGPLLNIDGDMIGINVAVRAGAQGIGFAIPIDNALNVATDLLSTRRIDRTWHGLIVENAKPTIDGALIKEVLAESPAERIGLRSGDIIKSVASRPVFRVLDIERALIGKQPGAAVPLTIERDSKVETIDLTLASLPERNRPTLDGGLAEGDRFWTILGLKLEAVPQRQFQAYRTKYRGGLVVTDVRVDGPAAKQGIRRGDILVGMHIWETITSDNVNYILDRPDFGTLEPVKFYIVRGTETLYGHLSVARNTQ